MAAFLSPFDTLAQEPAAPPCAPREMVLETLAKRFGEHPVAVALTSRGDLILVTASADGTTWSIALEAPGGLSCLVITGGDWRLLPTDAGGPPL